MVFKNAFLRKQERNLWSWGFKFLGQLVIRQNWTTICFMKQAVNSSAKTHVPCYSSWIFPRSEHPWDMHRVSGTSSELNCGHVMSSPTSRIWCHLHSLHHIKILTGKWDEWVFHKVIKHLGMHFLVRLESSQYTVRRTKVTCMLGEFIYV